MAEELVEKVVNGRVKLLWDKKGRRNEALDCLVYAYAALRISVQRWQLDLKLWPVPEEMSRTTMR